MGKRTWMKYLGIVAAFAGIGARVYSWLRSAEAPSSEGGEDITPNEIAALEPVITDAINAGLQAAEVPMMVEVKLVPLG